MRKRRQRILQNLLHEEVNRVLTELDGKTGMEIRLIFEREGIVDLIMALRDLRSTAVSRYLGQRQQDGQRVFQQQQVTDRFGMTRMVWRVMVGRDGEEKTNGDKETEGDANVVK